MKKIVLSVLVLILMIPVAAFADNIQTDEGKVISLSTKVPVGFYGFILAQTLYADSQLSSFGTDNNNPASYNKTMVAFNRVVDETVEPKNDGFLAWSVQNTRFGFRFSPYDFGGKNFEVDARIEMDFWSVTNFSASSVVPRIRRAYAGIGQERWHMLFGHEWDVFSPLNTATLNIGNNLWRQGNLGSRRPQIRFTYNHPAGDNGKIEAAVSANIPSNSLRLNDSANTTGIPMFEGRVGYMRDMKAGQMQAYLSGAYARHNNETAGADDVNNWAVAFSVAVPAHKYLQISGEFQYGYSMGMLLSNSSNTRRQRFVAGWAQIQSLWTKWLETNAGYGIEDLNDSQVLTGWVDRNQVAYLNFKFKPIDVFIIGIEYNYLRTNYKGSGASAANAGFLNVMYIF